MNKTQVWTAVAAAGILLIVWAVGLVVSNALRAQKAEELSKAALLEISRITDSAAVDNAISVSSENERNGREEIQPLPAETVDGRDYIGLLDIPTLDVRLPVMAEFSYENLEIAPARYHGDICSNDLVICAHNYDAHFGQLKELTVGDSVQFSDMEGRTYAFAVHSVDVISPTAIEAVFSGSSDLVLLTCAPGGRARILVSCESID